MEVGKFARSLKTTWLLYEEKALEYAKTKQWPVSSLHVRLLGGVAAVLTLILLYEIL